MFAEIFKYLTTQCPPHIKSMGYLKELIALEARFHRCAHLWQPHLEKTKAVISDAVATVENKRKVVVLGSGILADIPLRTLSENFETVVLQDVCFLKSTLKYLHPFSNIVCQTRDITGITDPLHAWEQSGQHADHLPLPTRPEHDDIAEADLVISANILSQLPLIPTTYLRRKRPELDEATLKMFCQGIIQSHLAALDTCSGSKCLITEIERQYCDGTSILETEDPLWGHALNITGETWLWDIAPKSETGMDYNLRNRVTGSFWQ